MDDFTQRMLERARQRRENLGKPSPTKKRSSNEFEDMKDASPKRHCIGTTDTDENTPLSSVTSAAGKRRLAKLIASTNTWEYESPKPTLSHRDENIMENTNRTPDSQMYSKPTPRVKISAEKVAISSNKSPVKWTSPVTATTSPTKAASPVRPVSGMQYKSPSKYSPGPHQFLTPVTSESKSPVAVSKLTVTLGSEKKATPEQVQAKSTKTPVQQTPNIVRRHLPDVIRQPVSLDQSMVEVTNTPVNNRKSLWEEKIAKSKKELEDAAFIQGPPKPPRSTPAFKQDLSNQAKNFKKRRESMNEQQSATVSPHKVGPGTGSIVKNLTKSADSWQRNQTASEQKDQRKAELEALQNRWKDGMLKEEVFRQQENASTVTVTKDNVPKKMQPLQSRREEAREKARNDFENKLEAMGFAVSSSPALGHIATADVKSSNQASSQSAHMKNVEGKNPQPKAVSIEEKKVTVTSFGTNKVTVKARTQEEPERLVGCNVALEMDDGERIVAMGSKSYNSATATSSAQKPTTPSSQVQKSTYSTTLTINPNQAKDGPSTPHVSQRKVGGASTTPATTPGGSSIYTLIKRQTPGFTTPGSRNALSNEDHGKELDEDSFEGSYAEDDDSFGETRIEDGLEHHYNDRHYQHRQSLTSSNSYDSTYSDSQSGVYTEDYSRDDMTTQSESDEYYDDDDGETVDSSEYSHSGACGVDTLLDEALDTETTDSEHNAAAPMPAPRVRGGNQEPTKRSTQHRQVQFRHTQDDSVLRHSESSDDERRVRLLEQQKNRTTWAEGMISTDTEDEQPLAYSLQMYRSTRRDRPPAQQVIKREFAAPKPQKEKDQPQYLPPEETKKRITALEEDVSKAQRVIEQTSNALNQCCGANSAFASSLEAVECHKILLITCKKREAYLSEIQRLRGRVIDDRHAPQGTLTISDIRLPLRQEFVTKLGSQADTMEHYFICLIRHNGHVITTQMVSTNDAIIHGSLEFPNLINLTPITQDFKLQLEVYGMHININQGQSKTPKKKKTLTPKKSHKLAMPSPGGPFVIRSSDFTLMSSLPLSMNSIHKTHFTLDKVPYQAPLLGTIHLKLTCLLETTVAERGFLTMFEDVSGFGSWHRRWVVLCDGKIKYWTYPDDERSKEPIGMIDLKQCISDTIGLIPRDVCARPNSFELVSVRRQKQGETDSLVKRVYNTMATTRHWFSADTKQERELWCDQLNEALNNLRAWHQDAMKPLKKIHH